MKLSRSLLSFFTALCLAGCGGSSDSTAGPGGFVAPGQLEGQVLQGRLKVGGLPVNNHQVQLRLNGQVLASTASDEFGNFQFDPQTLPDNQPIKARGTPLVDVVANIDGARYSSVLENGPEYVWVTELTTLVHDYLEDHPSATFEEANTAVGRSLGCPSGEEVEKLSDRDIFDPATFQQQADAEGGDQALFDKLGAGLGTQFYNFAAPDPYEALRLDGQDPHERVQPVQPKVGDSDISYGTLMGVFSDNLTSAFGWVVYRLGTNIDSDLGQTTASMSSLCQTFKQLHTELEPALDTTEAYFIHDLDTLPDFFGTYITELAGLVAARVAPTDTPFSLPPALVGFLAKEEYGDDQALLYAHNFLNTFYPFGSNEHDTIRSYNRLQMEILGRPTPDPVTSSYDLRYNQVTDKLLNNLNFHLTGARIAIDMMANSLHSQFLAPREPGNRLAGDIAFARVNTIPQLSESFRKAQQLVPPKLDRDDVIVLPPNFPGPVPGTPTLLHRGVWTQEFVWNFRFYHQKAPRWGERHSTYLAATIGKPWAGNSGWTLPDEQQMAELDKVATAAGGGDALQGMIKLGLYPAGSTGPVFLLYRNPNPIWGNAEGPWLAEWRNEINTKETVAVQTVWMLSAPGRPGGQAFLKLYGEDSGFRGRVHFYSPLGPNVYDFFGRVPLAAVFIRGSLSDNTQEQFQSLLSTGTSVRPRLDVSFEDSRAVARATYRFVNGQECTLDVSDRVAWKSDNPDVVQVSNLTGSYFPGGKLTITRPGSANITASLLVDGSQPASANGYVTGTSAYS